jgi:hypothetical protein
MYIIKNMEDPNMMCVTSALGGFAGTFFNENGPFRSVAQTLRSTAQTFVRGEKYERKMYQFYITNNSVLIY